MIETRPPGANPPLVHPGPVAERRRDIAPTAAAAFDITIEPGKSVEDAIGAAFDEAGFLSGCVWVEDLACDPLRYVIPAEPNDPSRLAWYSGTHAPDGGGVIERAYISVGRDAGALFTHCHGRWRLADGTMAAGHLLGGDTVAAAHCRVRAVGFTGAVFDRRQDEETGFSLFSAVNTGGHGAATSPGAVAITLHPNEDICIAIEETCRDLGIGPARILGLGSMNGADFEDGSRMASAITEYLVLAGRHDPAAGARIEILAVDADAAIFTGTVRRGRATVSITSELVVVPD